MIRVLIIMLTALLLLKNNNSKGNYIGKACGCRNNLQDDYLTTILLQLEDNKLKKMGCDYYVYTELVIEFQDGRTRAIRIEEHRRYCNDYDSDEETYEKYIERKLETFSEEKLLYKNGSWKIGNPSKYLELLKDEQENIGIDIDINDLSTTIKKMVKKTFASEYFR